ncbi:DUF4184 family protein [Paenibacillus lutrae]|uniref:DUF4184 family protein n=1 Tax=Paenibacillus lutrae TaxID=2078573 RepID=A0A7X3FNH1_9BACL|nr:DUF4184 family protein [Paenibacillus lutrae]MVP02599.1 DUF4184 family protein [Paenibacillus lutrae]
MPFTFAHPLYAGPLKLIFPRYLSLTGLILGSMSPDFEYFIALEPYRFIGHSVAGLFLQAIPLSILLAYVVHYILKIPLIDHLPATAQLENKARGLLRDWKLNSLRKWFVFLLSVIIGFYSHVLLDAFTHGAGFFVSKFGILQSTIMNVPLYKILQHTLSIAGLLTEGLLVFLLWKKAEPIDRPAGRILSGKRGYWVPAGLVTMATVILKVTLTSSTNYIGILVVSPITGFFIGLVAASIWVRRSVHKVNK